jgi:hypothetical protein
MTNPRPTPFRSPFGAGRSALTRRQLLMRAGALGAAGVSLPALLAACGGSDSDSGSSGTTPGTAGGGASSSGGSSSLFFENWPSYIDPTEDGATGTVDRFIAATGIDMRYTEAYNDNNEYFAKIQPLLGRGEPIDPDIIAPTSWLVNRLITLGWLEKLPLDQVANAANLRPDLQSPAWDPTGEYSLPWQTGFAGIAYNSDVTGRDITSVDDLFDPEFAGKVGALTEMRDTIGVIAMSLGIDISTLTTFDEARPAFDKLQEADPALPRQRLLRRSLERQPRDHDRMVGRRRRDRPRQSGGQVRVPRERCDGVGRHDGGAEGCPQRRSSRSVDELRLRPGAGRADHGVGRLRVTRCGRPRGSREARRRARQRPAHLP